MHGLTAATTRVASLRRLLILTATTALLALVAAPAYATVTETLTGVSIRPTNAGTKRFPAKSNLVLNATVAESSGKLASTDRLIIDFDKNLQLMGKYFPSCSGPKLTAGQQADLPACAKAKMGTAKASAIVYDPNGSSSKISFTTNLYNGPKGKQLIAYVVVPGTSVQSAMIGTITRGKSPYGVRVTFVIPPALKQPLPGLFPSLDNFQLLNLGRTTATKQRVPVGKKVVRRKVGYLESTGCTGRKFKIAVGFDFQGSTPDSFQTAAPSCTK